MERLVQARCAAYLIRNRSITTTGPACKVVFHSWPDLMVAVRRFGGIKNKLNELQNISVMKLRLSFLLELYTALFAVSGCGKKTALEIQQPYTYDEQYYANLRAYKKTQHTLAFGWYAAYAPIEGSTGYKDPASWGERIIGLPD